MAVMSDSVLFLRAPTLFLYLLFACMARFYHRLRVMGNHGYHMTLVDYDYFGDKQVMRWGCLVWRVDQSGTRRSEELLYWVDNGDWFAGHTIGRIVAKGRVLRFGETHPAFKAMNFAGLRCG